MTVQRRIATGCTVDPFLEICTGLRVGYVQRIASSSRHPNGIMGRHSFSKSHRGCEPMVHRSGILKRCGESSFRVRTHSNQSHPMVLFGPP